MFTYLCIYAQVCIACWRISCVKPLIIVTIIIIIIVMVIIIITIFHVEVFVLVLSARTAISE